MVLCQIMPNLDIVAAVLSLLQCHVVNCQCHCHLWCQIMPNCHVVAVAVVVCHIVTVTCVWCQIMLNFDNVAVVLLLLWCVTLSTVSVAVTCVVSDTDSCSVSLLC